MRRTLRFVRAIIKWFAILGGAAILIVLFVNARDQELTPEARSLAEFQHPHVPDEQNAYLAFIGFDAPKGTDPIAAGARLVAEHDAAVLSDPWGRERATKHPQESPSAPDESYIKFIETTYTPNDSLDRPALPWALNHADDIGAATKANHELVARYIAMQRLPVFADTSLPDPFLPTLPSAAWSGPRRLLLMQSALDAQTGQVPRALDFLAADIAMWRRILGSGGYLIEEMIAVRGLAADFRVLSDLIASPAFDVAANEARLRQLLAPLSPAELNVATMFKKEFEGQARLLAALPEEAAKWRSEGWIEPLTNGSPLFPVFFKPNASVNLLAQQFSEMQMLASPSPSNFVLQRQKLESDTRAISKPGIGWIYNPIGRKLVAIGVLYYPDYVARVFDLDAYVRLARAQLELRLAGVAPGQVLAFLNAASQETRNPYTGQPFDWNASNNDLSFEPMSSRWHEWRTEAAVPAPVAY